MLALSNPVGAVGPPPSLHAIECRAEKDLAVIREPGVTLAWWRRGLPDDIAGQLAALVPGEWPSFRHIGTPAALCAALAEDAPAVGRPESPLGGDIAHLARLYARIVGSPIVSLRLEPVLGNGCKYFHADHVGVRLLCTYRGAGTLWLPDDAVVRKALRQGDNGAVVADSARVRQLQPGDVALLKGEAWPGNRGHGLVHRSPPADPSRPRLLLCIDHDND